MESNSNVINAEKALRKICENNNGFEFENDKYKSAMIAAKYNHPGGIGFIYQYNESNMIIQISDSKNEINLEYVLEENKSAEWFYLEFQRLYKLATDTLSTLKNNKTK